MLTYRLLPFTYRWADAVIAVSQGVAGELRAISPALSPLIKVIGTPVISEEIVRLGDEQPRHPWFQP
jgi:hypothetical protein